MKISSLVTRLGIAVLVVAMLAAGLVTPGTRVQAADPDTFYGSWPYTAPPKGHLNSFVPSNVVSTSGIGVWGDLVEPPSAFYVWSTGEWKPLLAKSWGFKGNDKYVITLRDDVTWSD